MTIGPPRNGRHRLRSRACRAYSRQFSLDLSALRGLEPDVSLNHLKPLALALSVAAAFAPAFAHAAPPVVLDESKLLQTPRFDAKDLDPKAPVCQDLNAYVNGRWMASTPI